MLELFRQGGWVMYPLLASSVLAIAVILERGFFFIRTRQNLAAFIAALGRAPEKPAGKNRGYLGRMARLWSDARGEDPAALTAAALTAAAVEEKIFAGGSEIVREAEKNLAVLAGVGQLAPLMGLFGTVLGMIDVFRKLETIGGRADVGLLSGGIWVALLTTAFGLLVAIPAIAAHQYFSGLAGLRSDNLQFLVSHLKARAAAESPATESLSAESLSAETPAAESLSTEILPMEPLPGSLP